MSERQYVLLGLLCLVIALMIGVYTTVSNALSVRGGEYQRLVDETDKIQKENLLLKEQLLQDEALTTINQKARAKGFTDAKNYVYIK